MKKIKIIYADYDELQKEVDQWIEKNPSVEIVSASIGKGEGYTSIISIVYEEKSHYSLNS